MKTETSFPDFIFTLTDMPEAGLARVPVIVTGQWEKKTAEGKQQIVVTLADMAAMRANFSAKANGEINVDYDHKSEKGHLFPEPIPSAGRLTALSAPEPFTDRKGVERHILWGDYDPTERARQLVRSKEYRWISAAWYANGKGDAELSSVALTNNPLMREMPQVQLSDASFYEVESGKGQVARENNSRPSLATDHLPLATELKTTAAAPAALKEKRMKATLQKLNGEHAVVDANGKPTEIVIDHTVLQTYAAENFPSADRTAEHRTAFLAEMGAPGKDAGYVKERLTLAAQLETASRETASRTLILAECVKDGVFNEASLENLEDSERIDRKTARQARRVTKLIADNFAEGKVTPAMRGAAIKLAMNDVETFTQFLAALPVAASFKPVSLAASESGNAAGDFLLMVAARETEKKIPYDQALAEVTRENPALYAEYVQSVRGK